MANERAILCGPAQDGYREGSGMGQVEKEYRGQAW
jgi:hypothetical protein